MTRTRLLALPLLAALLAGCSAAASPSATGQPAIQLSATLIRPTDIRLTWRASGPEPAGRILEYATAPAGPFTILGFLPPGQTAFTHSLLMPGTTFYYRVQPFYGPTTNTVGVSLPPGKYHEPTQAQEIWALPRTLPGNPVAQHSIRTPRTAAAGAPAGLRATIVHGNGVELTWVDHASNEEGYFVEIKSAGSTIFHVIEVLQPHINSCGIVVLPDEEKASYRVRAFYYGSPSNLVHRTTGGV